MRTTDWLSIIIGLACMVAAALLTDIVWWRVLGAGAVAGAGAWVVVFAPPYYTYR